MQAADLIFWYTGAGAWGLLAFLLFVAVIVGLFAAAAWAYRHGRSIAIEKLCIAKLRDMDLTNADVSNAFRAIRWPDDASDILEQIGKVQQRLRDRTSITWERKRLLAEFEEEGVPDEMESRLHDILTKALAKNHIGNDEFDRHERHELLGDLARALYTNPKDT